MRITQRTISRSRHKTIKRPPTGWKIERVTTHPGVVLREDFLIPLGMSVNALSIRQRISAPRLHAILHERRAVTPDTANASRPLLRHIGPVLAQHAAIARLTKAQQLVGE